MLITATHTEVPMLIDQNCRKSDMTIRTLSQLTSNAFCLVHSIQFERKTLPALQTWNSRFLLLLFHLLHILIIFTSELVLIAGILAMLAHDLMDLEDLLRNFGITVWADLQIRSLRPHQMK